MPITFDPAAKRIILDSASVSATEIFSRWEDWAAQSDNIKYGVVIRQVGSDDLGSGLSIPPYYFLQNGWRVRPMESSHNLTITGNLFVEGGGVPVVSTLGTYQVNVNYTVPVQAQGIATSGSSGPTEAQIAAAVWAYVTRTLTSSSTSLQSQAATYKTVANSQTASDPGAGKVKWNNSTQASSTEIYLDSVTQDGLDVTNYFGTVAAGSILYLQDKDDASKWQRWTINAIADNAGWITLSVSLTASAGGNLAHNVNSVITITNAIATAPTPEQNAAAILAAAQVTPIYSDMRKTNGQAIIGDGTESNQFRSHLVG